MSFLAARICIVLDNAWVLIPLLVLMRLGVIAREERHLAWRFGERHLIYKASVRRWP